MSVHDELCELLHDISKYRGQRPPNDSSQAKDLLWRAEDLLLEIKEVVEVACEPDYSSSGSTGALPVTRCT